MPGMLSEDTPSSGPIAPTPPAASPGAGDPPSGMAPGSGQPQVDAQALKDQAVQLVYGERFDQLIEMFQTNGADKFARSMAIAVNTAIQEIEKTQGAIGPEIAAEIGADLFAKLLEDMLIRPKDGMKAVVEGVTAEELQEVLPAILVMYADAHPEVSKEDVQAVMMEVSNQAGGAQQTGDVESATRPESKGPTSPPANSITPGGP